MSYYAIIYATANGQIRRIIASDEGLQGHEVGSIHPLVKGEGVLYVRSGQNHGPDDWAAQVFAATGKLQGEQMAALIDDTNTVIGVICADAEIDSAPEGLAMANCHPEVHIGSKFNPTTRMFSE